MNPQDLLNKAQLMSQQTKAQGVTPFLGSSFDGTAIDASKVSTPTTPLNLKTKPELPMPNIANLVSSEVASPIAPVVPETKPASWPASWADKLSGLFGQTKNKETDLASAVDTATSPYTKQLNELNTQIKMQQANAVANQEAAINRVGGTTGSNSIAAQQQSRTDAIETLKLSALAEGMRGNIALAEQHATNAINAKYAQVNADIETAKSNIYDNWDNLTPVEKKKAEATLLRIDKEDAFVKMQMEDEKITQGFLQEAIKQSQDNGKPIDTLTLSRASKAGTPTEALQILAPYMADANAKALALEKLKGERLQNEKIGLEISALKNPSASGVVNAQGKPLTDAQSTSLGYANRLAQANVIINQLGSNFTGGKSIVGGLLPNIYKSEDRQKYEQAQRNFVNAVLRQESGAAIAPSEFESAQKQYFPQPGDSEGTVAQKKANRDLAYQNLLQRAGNPQVSPETKTVKGVTYKKGEDGKYYAQ